MKNIRIPFLRALMAVSVALLAGQAAGQQAQQMRTCRILYLSSSGVAPKGLHLFDGVTSREVDLPRMNLSKVYKIAPGPVILRMFSEPVTDPKALPAGAPSVKVPASAEHIYLLVTGDRSNAVAPVKLVVVDADYKQLASGQMLWFNMTKKTVAGKIGSSTLRVKPGARAVLKEPARGRESYPVELYFRIPGDDFTHPLCETRWRHDPRSRALAFIMQDGNRRVPRIFTYSDFRQPAKEKQDP